MAIVQISRITQRKGLEQDLPQPLAGAEFGWAVDQRRLFIGNGDIADGAPVVGNTEILTEFSDVLALAGAYTYKGEAAGYIVQTGPTTGDPVSQSIQSRLDSYAIVTDFGAQGDGATDDTAAINRALYQLYCVQANTEIRRALFFPAGTYIVTDTLLIPPFAKLYGEGADSTIIYFRVELWQPNTAYSQGVLVKYPTATPGEYKYYRSLAPVPATGIAITNASYWSQNEILPEFVVETANSFQQSGVNIATNGATLPQRLEFSSMTFQTTETGNVDTEPTGHNICMINRAQQCYFDSVNFVGPLTTDTLTTPATDLSGVVFDGTANIYPEQITFSKCRFYGITYGVNTDVKLKGITVENCWFDTLYQGVVLGSSTVENGGPTGVRIMHNMFDNIYGEGIIINGCSLNATGYNTFYDVGNYFFGVTQPQTPIITINADQNISVGDMFQRTDEYSKVYPRIKIYNDTTLSIPTSTGFSSSSKLQFGAYTRQVGTQVDLTEGTTSTLFTVATYGASATLADYGVFSAFAVDYTITRLQVGTYAVRTGRLVVVAGGDDSAGDGLVWTDDYSENEQTDVTINISESSDIITVSCTTATTGEDAKIYYSITHLA